MRLVGGCSDARGVSFRRQCRHQGCFAGEQAPVDAAVWTNLLLWLANHKGLIERSCLRLFFGLSQPIPNVIDYIIKISRY